MFSESETRIQIVFSSTELTSPVLLGHHSKKPSSVRRFTPLFILFPPYLMGRSLRTFSGFPIIKWVSKYRAVVEELADSKPRKINRYIMVKDEKGTYDPKAFFAVL